MSANRRNCEVREKASPGSEFFVFALRDEERSPYILTYARELVVSKEVGAVEGSANPLLVFDPRLSPDPDRAVRARLENISGARAQIFLSGGAVATQGAVATVSPLPETFTFAGEGGEIRSGNAYTLRTTVSPIEDVEWYRFLPLHSRGDEGPECLEVQRTVKNVPYVSLGGMRLFFVPARISRDDEAADSRDIAGCARAFAEAAASQKSGRPGDTRNFRRRGSSPAFPRDDDNYPAAEQAIPAHRFGAAVSAREPRAAPASQRRCQNGRKCDQCGGCPPKTVCTARYNKRSKTFSYGCTPKPKEDDEWYETWWILALLAVIFIVVVVIVLMFAFSRTGAEQAAVRAGIE